MTETGFRVFIALFAAAVMATYVPMMLMCWQINRIKRASRRYRYVWRCIGIVCGIAACLICRGTMVTGKWSPGSLAHPCFIIIVFGWSICLAYMGFVFGFVTQELSSPQ